MTNSAAGAYVGVACVADGILVRGVLFFRCHAKRAAPQIDLYGGLEGSHMQIKNVAAN